MGVLIHIGLPLASALGAIALAGAAWRRATRAGRLFALLCLASALASLGDGFGLLSLSLGAKLGWLRAAQLGLALAPALWMLFALEYAGREKWLNPRAVLLALALPALTVGLSLSNDAHLLVWRSVRLNPLQPASLQVAGGPWLWIQGAYALAFYLQGGFVIALSMVRAPALMQRQGLALLAGTLLLWAGHLPFLPGLEPLGQGEVLPALALAGIGIIIYGLARYRLLDVLPVARDTLVDSSADGLVVLDTRDRVVDLNPAAQQVLGLSQRAAIGRPAQVLNLRPDLLRPGPSAPAARAEVTLGAGPAERIYDVSVTPLLDSRGRAAGRLIALRDISKRKQVEAELRAQKQLFENLVAVARATSEGPTLQATLQNVLNVSAALTGARGGSLFLLGPAGEVTHSLLTVAGFLPSERSDLVRRVMDHGLAGWVVRERQAALVTDTNHDPRWAAPAHDAPPAGAALGVPILSGGVLLGVLILTHRQPGGFTGEHLHLMQAAADQMALAVRNAQMFEAQRQMAQRQAAVYGVLRAVGEQLEPVAVARGAVDGIMELVAGHAGWSSVNIAVADYEHGVWVNQAASGRLAAKVGERFPIEGGIIGRALRTGRPQAVPDVLADPDYLAGHTQTRSELAVPLRRGEHVLGVLNLESERPNAFSPDDTLLAESLADAVALALDNANLYAAIAGESSRLQALIKSSRDGICMASMNGHILVLNQPVLRLLNLGGAPEDWLGHPMVDMFAPLRRHAPRALATLLAEMRRLRRGETTPAEGEGEVPPRTLRWLSLPVEAGPVPLGRLLVLSDVTAERLAQKLRSDLTDTLVHDLRNPLANIRMALQILTSGRIEAPASNGSAEQSAEEVLAIALSSTQRMLTLVNAILDVNRLESGQMPLDREPLNLRALAGDVLRLQRPLADERCLRLENHIPERAPVVLADDGLVRRVLENLVGNAVKFTPEDGVVTVSAVWETNPPRVVVSVRDSGAGLPPGGQALFQKFATGPQSARGSGWGLAFCKLAIEAHGGRIWAESEPGRGATFHFSLPFEIRPEALAFPRGAGA